MKIDCTQATIMIIDDEPENLNVLSETLRQNGWTVQAFPGGAMALAAAREDPPDVVLLDIRMPGMNGYDVCHLFKADDALRAIPIIFISALSAAQDIAVGLECGGVDYIAKPFRQAEVRARVQVHLALRRAYLNLDQANVQLRVLEHDRDLLGHLLVQDLRSPLQEVRTQLERIANEAGGTLHPDHRNDLCAAIHGTRRLSQIVSTGVYLSRMVYEGIPLHLKAVKANEIIAAACTQIAAPTPSHRIVTAISADCPALLCDAGLSELIVANLLAHALKHAPLTSEIVLGAQPDPAGVRIWVRYQGAAIAASHPRGAFARFGATSPLSSKLAHATSLTMAFCKLMIEAQGGTLGVEGEFTRASYVWFTLPAAPAQ
jgi:DNA-binding response OmpR family regulator